MFVNKILHISRPHISKSKRCFNVKSSTCYFHMKTKILVDFQICISLPLMLVDEEFHPVKSGACGVDTREKGLKPKFILFD